MDPNQHLRNLVPRPDLNGLLAGTPKSPVKPIIKELLTKASLYQSRNKIQEAIGIYDKILSIEESNTEALVHKGICMKLLGKTKEAHQVIWKALSLNSTDPFILTTAGTMYKEGTRLNEAIAMYKQAIFYDREYGPAKENLSVTLTDLGTHLKMEGNIKEGMSKYMEALAYDQKYAPAYYNLGVVHSELNEYHEALFYYNKAVEFNPYYCEAYCNIGVIYKNMDKLEDAIAHYEKALNINPNFEIAKHNLAIAYTDIGTKIKNEGKVKEAVRLYKRALIYNSKYSDAYYNLGVAHGERGQFDKAIYHYEMSIHFNPACSVAYNNLGVIYKNRDNLSKAIECYQAALRINPKFSQTLNNLGVVYTVQGKLEEAYAAIKSAIRENPNYVEAYNNLGVLYRDECDIQEAITCYDKCLQMQPNSRNAGQNRLLAMNYLENLRVDKVYEAHREWGDRFEAQYEPYMQWDNARTSDRRIKIGYLSPDFFVHSVSYFVEAILKHYNKQQYHITCYSNVVKPDHKTERLKSYVDQWRSVYGLDARSVAHMIRQDGIDLLIELTGHTAGNRLDVMALKPAPVQITYIGYPNTTGMRRIDYRLTDALVDPQNTRQEFTEQLVRLPKCFLCYTPAPESGDVPPLPCLKNGFVTFGSFNNLAKINMHVCETWAKIIKAVPNSRLVVKCKPFVSEKVRKKFWEIFERCGVDSTRIDLMGLLPLHRDHLSAYGLVDLSLDTWPYAGTTTTCEALWMGVPVVTLQGEACHAHNVGVSLLTQVGHERFIARTIDEYIKIAISLASDVSHLQEIRRTLRAQMSQSYLCDGAAFTQHLEGVYRELWMRWCTSSVPSASNGASVASLLHPANTSAPLLGPVTIS